MQYLSYKSRLVDLAASGRHHNVKVDPVSVHRLIAWVDSCCVYMGKPEIRPLGVPDFPGIERLPGRATRGHRSEHRAAVAARKRP